MRYLLAPHTQPHQGVETKPCLRPDQVSAGSNAEARSGHAGKSLSEPERDLDSSIGTEETLLEEYKKEKDQYEMRIASLERQLGYHSRKIDLVLELLATRAEMSKDEVDLCVQERLKDLVPRILVVDDEPDFRRFAKDALDSFSVLEAQSGKEALQIVREEQFDLVIADIKMPDMDGY